MVWFLAYWVICGLITFSLTQPTVYIFNFPGQVLGEFILCLLLGGIVIPILAIIGIIYFIKVMLFDKEE